MMPPLRAWKAGAEATQSFKVYDFSPVLRSNKGVGGDKGGLYALENEEWSKTPDQRVSDDERALGKTSV
jgi:hypothetical protein